MNESRTERLFMGFFLAAVLACAWMESSSSVSTQWRNREPWAAWLLLRNSRANPAQPPAAYLLVYRPEEPSLHVILLPEDPLSRLTYQSRLSTGEDGSQTASTPAADRALAQYFASTLKNWIEPRLTLRYIADTREFRSPEEIKRWMLSWPRSLRFWLGLPRVLSRLRELGNPEPGLYDLGLLAREAFHLEPSNIRLYYLPKEMDRPLFFSRIQGTVVPEAAQKPATLEVLNASGEPKVALEATKILRSRSLDVVDYGNALETSKTTRFIDWTSSSKDAGLAASALGCGQPEIISQMDTSRMIRVTVVLGQDFRNCSELKRAMRP